MQYCAYCVLSAPIASVGKLVWVQCGWEAVLEMCQDQSLKALHNNGCECYGMVVIQARRGGVFRHWHNGCGLKACWHSCLGVGQVENVCEDPCKLLCKCPEHTSRNAVGASSLACVDPAQCCVDICGGEFEGLMVC